MTEIATDWLTRALVRAREPLRMPHRQPCAACAGSPLLRALLDFAGWPHPLVHPLIGRVTEMVEHHARQSVEDALQDAGERWLARVAADEDDGGIPDDEHLLWAAAEYRLELDEARDAEEAEAERLWRAATLALERFCSSHALVARDVVELLMERAMQALDRLEPGAVMDFDEAEVLTDALEGALAAWTVWLPTGGWSREPAVAQGRLCADCRAVARIVELAGPHGAVHRLALGFGGVLLEHLETFGGPRAEPPAASGSAAYQRDVVRAYARWFDAARARIDNVLRLYVLDEVERQVAAASQHLLVAPGDAPE
ncbi:MAG TPA: hypothetical protein VNR36_03645 [Pseudolysinimonas sp.]|nr:hypothetical protein [Pseudolysinimonas sp.]